MMKYRRTYYIINDNKIRLNQNNIDHSVFELGPHSRTSPVPPCRNNPPKIPRRARSCGAQVPKTCSLTLGRVRDICGVAAAPTASI